MTVRPFHIDIPDAVVRDLQDRLAHTRWPSVFAPDSWDDGPGLSFMIHLVDHWRYRFDWRVQETRLNALPHYMTRVEGQDIHFLHQPGIGPSPMPLILTHGWPGSFIEFEHLMPMLADPASHGGDPADAFHVVVPSLPGYGFSAPPQKAGTSSREIAGLWRGLMAKLGYERFGAQGGDIGAGVSIWLARLYSDSVLGVHLNYVPASFQPWLEQAQPLTSEEQAFLDKRAYWSALEGAYGALHATKPQTLAFSLNDSPVGLAAWIVEKVRSWSDCGGDLESCISLDTLLTDISLYWFSDSLAHSLRLYKENRLQPLTFRAGEVVVPPLGVAVFPRELPMPPRSWMERVFNIERWTTMTAGGHFAALEQPDLLAEEVRAFFRPLRGRLS
ncbi:epoxide hydrolase [bacterium M00.F.Ca.ET.230.01.1.1]|nr:epoxide hydrolase [bacterium M00.F.Ca.ET.230.01.1.1]